MFLIIVVSAYVSASKVPFNHFGVLITEKDLLRSAKSLVFFLFLFGQQSNGEALHIQASFPPSPLEVSLLGENFNIVQSKTSWAKAERKP